MVYHHEHIVLQFWTSLWVETGISQNSIYRATWPIQAKSAFVSGSIGVVGGYRERGLAITSTPVIATLALNNSAIIAQ